MARKKVIVRRLDAIQNLGAMDAYCWQHGGSITEDRRSYGYIAETENYRFCLRCTPFPGEYQGYLYCYDLCQQEMYRQEHPVVGRVTFASGEQQEFTDSRRCSRPSGRTALPQHNRLPLC